MEEELMFNIDAINPHQPKAVVYSSDNKERCVIQLGRSIHLWHIDLVLAAYRLYWTGEGKRDASLNEEDGITYIAPPGVKDTSKDMTTLAKRIINAVCRNGRYDQPNLLRKINDGRYILLKRDFKKDVEIYVSGGYENPYFFVRRIDSADVIQNFNRFEDAMAYSH